MCSNYIPARPESLQHHFGVLPQSEETKSEAFPGSMAPIILLARNDAGEHGDTPECVPAMFGMVPGWADMKLARSTYNARTETVAVKPSFRHAWRKRQFCVVPAESIFEPSYETGRAVRWNISHADGMPLGVAGIWDWRPNGPNGDPLVSFSMLTINADEHPLMRRFHKPTDEKRMLVFLARHEYDNWLHADVEEARSLFVPFPVEQLVARPAPIKTSERPVMPGSYSTNASLFD